MPFNVTEYSRFLPVSSAHSQWIPAHNPALSLIERIDDVITGTANNGGLTQITVVDGAVVTAGSIVFINTVAGGGLISGVFTVTTIVNPTNFVIDSPWNGFVETGFVNYNSDYPSYHFLVRVIKVETNGDQTVLAVNKIVPFSDGVIRADIGAIIRKSVDTGDDYDYIASSGSDNEIDSHLSNPIIIDYAEVYSQVQQPFDVAWTEYAWVVNAALQIDAPYGANMAQFVPEPTGQDQAKFLTKFSKPTIWRNLPQDLSFIFSNLLGDEIGNSPSTISTLSIRETYYNGNSTISTYSNNIDLTKFDYINRYPMHISVLPALFPAFAWETATRLTVFIRANPGSLSLTESKEIKVKDYPTCPIVYLKWLNTNGGWDFWCFEFNQSEGLKVAGGEQFSKFIEEAINLIVDPSFPHISREEKNYLTKKATPSFNIGADQLDADDLEGIKNLLYSPKVMMLYNPSTWTTDGVKWLPVLVEPGSFKLKETGEPLFNIQLTIQLVEIEIQSL